MGGYAGGEIASQLAVTTLFEQYYNGPTTGDVGADLITAIRKANGQVHGEAQTDPNHSQMGTTLTLVLVKGNKAIFGNVGDSRTYLIRQGIPERVTHDHSLVQEQVDAGVLTPEQAERSGHKNFITRAIGHRDQVDPDLFERELQVGDVLLLCSDGLHGLVKELEMGTIIQTTPDLKEAVKQLVALANERGGPDNITALAVRIQEVGDPLPSLLNGREAVYNQPGSIYSQATAPTAFKAAEAPDTLDNRPTAPMSVAALPPVPASISTQPTTPMTIPTEHPKPRGQGLVVGAVLLLMLGAAIIGAFYVFNNTPPALPNSTPASSATPASVTPSVSPSASTTTVAPLATITPAPATPTAVSKATVTGSAQTAVNSAGSAINSAIPSPSATVVSGAVATLAAIQCQDSQVGQVAEIQIQISDAIEIDSYQISLTTPNNTQITDFTSVKTGLYQKTVSNLTEGIYTLTVSKINSFATPVSRKVLIGATAVSDSTCKLIGNQLLITL